jgi:hypothetical protein
MNRKNTVGSIEWKSGRAGIGRAVIATLNVVDKQGDVSVPGSFPIGKSVPMSCWNHASWDSCLPAGKGVISADHERAYFAFEFFLDTSTGREHYEVLKGLGPLAEWSYGYTVVEASHDPRDLAPFGASAVRVLRRVDVHEASPVLRGAGVGTRTQMIKATPPCGCSSMRLSPEDAAIIDRAALVAEVGALKQTLDEVAAVLGPWHRYRYSLVASEDVPHEKRAAAETAAWYAAQDLGIPVPPVVRWFLPTKGTGDFGTERLILGTIRGHRNEVLLHARQTPTEAASTVAHEVRHLSEVGISEDVAREYERVLVSRMVAAGLLPAN